MTTRLTKEMRDKTIISVLRGTTYETKRKDITNRLAKRACDFVNQQQPEAFRKLIKGHPKEWFRQQAELQMEPDKSPLTYMRALGVQNTFKVWRASFDDSVAVAFIVQKSILFDDSCADLVTEAEALAVWLNETEGSLRTFLYSCGTVEKVLERMPELAGHLPTAAKSYPLVAPSNALAMLTKMGFDQTVKK